MNEDATRSTFPRSLRRDRWLVAAVALLGVIVTWHAAPRAIQAGDAGEFTTVMLRGGVPHPSGYPWMRALGLPASALEAVGLPGPLAAALPCAALGWLGWCVLAWSVLARIDARPASSHVDGTPAPRSDAPPSTPAILSVLAVALAATSGLAVLHVHDAEVWGPLVLGIALVIHVATGEGPPRPALLGLVLGLVTSHHLTAVLLTPLVIGAAWPPRASRTTLARTLLVGLAGVTAGLTPLLTLFVRAREGAWRWGDTSTVEGWLHHILRRDFGTFQLGLQQVSAPYTSKVHRELASLGESLLLPSAEASHVTEGPLGVVAVVVGVVAVAGAASLLVRSARAVPPFPGPACARDEDDPTHPIGAPTSALRTASAPRDPLLPLRPSTSWGLLVSLALAVLVFPTAANLDPRSLFAAWILERFDLLPLVLLVWVLAIAGARASSRLAPALRTALVGTLASLVIVRAMANVAAVAPAHEGGVEAYARDVLASPGDARALVFGTDDHRTFPALYVASVDPPPGAARYIDASLLAHAWYRARFAPELDLADKPIASMDRALAPAFAAQARGQLAPTRPMYVTHAFSRPVAGLPLEPEGILWRVAIEPGLDRSLEAVVARHEAALLRCAHAKASHAGLLAPRAHPWSSDLLASRAAPTRALLQRLQGAGRRDLADIVHAAWITSHGS